MDAYGLSRAEVESVIKKGMKWKEEREEKWHARMMGTECVFMRKEDNIFVITVYPEGGKP